VELQAEARQGAWARREVADQLVVAASQATAARPAAARQASVARRAAARQASAAQREAAAAVAREARLSIPA
jgi:hypothetical protein